MSAILRREAQNSSSPVLLDSVPQIARHSGVQAARPAGKNVDAVVAIHRMPQEWTKPSRETTKREDDPSAFLSFALCFLPYALFFAPCPLPFSLPFALFFALFFTLSSRTASCADALRDLLFACWFLRLFLYVVIPSEAAFADEGPAVRFCFCQHHRHRAVLEHSEGVLEVSAPHLCFSNHSHSALLLRVFH
jgi:hypothetical protein